MEPNPPAAPDAASSALTITKAHRVPDDFLVETMEQAEKWADKLSKTPLAGASYGKPNDCFLIIVTGRELGLSVMQSLRGMHVINNKATMSAETMLALILTRRDVCEYFELRDSSPKAATFAAKRVGARKEAVLTYTFEEAKLAGLTSRGDSNWNKYPATMCRWRCISHLARAVFADVTMGMRSPDEVEDDGEMVERLPPLPVTQTPPASPQAKKDEVVDAEYDETTGVVSGPDPKEPKATGPEKNTDAWIDSMLARVAAAQTMEDLKRIVEEMQGATHPRKDDVANAYGVKRREISAKAQR